MKILTKLNKIFGGKQKKIFVANDLVDASNKIYEYLISDENTRYSCSGIWTINDRKTMRGVVIDLDGKDPITIPFLLEHPPTYISCTSDGHYHCYYMFTEDVPNNEKNKHWANIWEQRCLSDPHHTNGDLRIPNTINDKYDCVVEWIKTDGPLYNPQVVLNNCCDYTPVPKKKRIKKNNDLIEHEKLCRIDKETKKSTSNKKQAVINRAKAKSDIVSFYNNRFKKTNSFNQKILPLESGSRHNTLKLVARHNYRGINRDDNITIRSLVDLCYAHPDTTTSGSIEQSYYELTKMIDFMWDTHDPSKENHFYEKFGLIGCDIDTDDEFSNIKDLIQRQIIRCINYAIVHGKGFLSQGLISERIGVSKSTISRKIKDLKELGKIEVDMEKYNNDLYSGYKAYYYNIIRKPKKMKKISNTNKIISPLSFCVSRNKSRAYEEDLFEITRIDEKPPDPGPAIDFGEIPRLAADQEVIQLNDEARQLAGLVYDL